MLSPALIFQPGFNQGDTAAAVSTDNEEIHQITTEVFKRAGFCGLGSVEFKLSSKDKKYYITEPTVCRNDLQSYIAVAGGINLSLMAYHEASGNNIKISNNKKKSRIYC